MDYHTVYNLAKRRFCIKKNVDCKYYFIVGMILSKQSNNTKGKEILLRQERTMSFKGAEASCHNSNTLRYEKQTMVETQILVLVIKWLLNQIFLP